MDKKQIQKIRRTVRGFYHAHGRHELPWRKTTNPYHILVSEVMLQQTQVVRVVPKYLAFIKKFPTLQKLAQAPLRDVLVSWHGLGYNRRAKSLHEASKQVVQFHKGKMPSTFEALCTLKGVGPYTAGAVCAFSYNIPIPLIETNIRTVFFHHLYHDDVLASDAELLSISKACLDRKNPREWFWALMDYGSSLKEKGVRTNSRSKHYVKQSKFKGSDREVRGAIVRVLTGVPCASEKEIQKQTTLPLVKISAQLSKLKKEGIVHYKNKKWSL
jgi:A/G-specific adenine glycosylase